MPTLLAEDLLLLLLDDERGTPPSGLDLKGPLGGAVLAELALLEAVTVDPGARRWSRSTVTAVAATHEDPVLSDALATIAEKPRSAEDLVGRLGKELPDRLRERLAERGLLQRREGRVLGIFPRTTWPAADATHEAGVRRDLTAVLVQGVTPQPRTGALVGLLHAVDRAHRTVEHDGLPAREVRKRAKQLAEGDWAAKAVRDAIAAATAATTAAVTVAATTTSS